MMVIFKDFINITLKVFTLSHQSWHVFHGASQISASGMVGVATEHSGSDQMYKDLTRI